MVKKGARKTAKKPLSEWNKFVMEVKKQNPEKMFKDVLVLAGQLKKKGVTYADFAKNKTLNAAKKVKNTLTAVPKVLTKKVKKVIRKTSKKLRKTGKRKGKKN